MRGPFYAGDLRIVALQRVQELQISPNGREAANVDQIVRTAVREFPPEEAERLANFCAPSR